MLDIKYNPSGSTCYGLSASEMVAWVKDFGETYNSKIGRYPIIYTTADWWKTCTGDSTAFGKDYPLVLAQYSSSFTAVPSGWSYQSFWQNTDSYTYGGDSDIWNGSEDSLKTFAKGSWALNCWLNVWEQYLSSYSYRQAYLGNIHLRVVLQ